MVYKTRRNAGDALYISIYLSLSFSLDAQRVCAYRAAKREHKIFASLVLGKERKNHPSQFRVFTIFRV